MLSNCARVSWRQLRRNKLYTAVNVAGLATGFTVALLILLFVAEEWTFDAFHREADTIYRVVGRHETNTGGVEWTARMDGPLAPLLTDHIPSVERTARVARGTVSASNGAHEGDMRTLFVDPAFLEILSFPLVAGSRSGALQSPESIVLTAAQARQYFGSADAVGRTLNVQMRDETFPMTVTGIVAHVPHTSSIQFDALLPISIRPRHLHPLVGDQIFTHWGFHIGDTYVQLAEQADQHNAEALINTVVERYRADGPTGYTARPPIDRYALQPITDMYLQPEVESRVTASSRPQYSYILGGIAVLILILACINFATLAIGSFADRGREVGVRKVMGANAQQIRLRFWGEALCTTILALCIGLIIAAGTLPAFNALVQRSLSLDTLATWPVLATILTGVVIVSLVASGYPAWILARLQPAAVLRGRMPGQGRHRIIRGLIVMQFTLALFLLVGALGMARQLRFVQDTSLGFDKDQVIALRNDTDIETETLMTRIRQQAERRKGIQAVSGASGLYGEDGFGAFNISLGDSASTVANWHQADDGYEAVMGLELIAGRPLPSRPDTTKQYSLINAALVRALGVEPRDLIGITLEPTSGNLTLSTGEIVGVVDNYHYETLHQSIEPLIITSISPSDHVYVLVRLDSYNMGEALQHLEATWSDVTQGAPFAYTFLSDRVRQQYEDDQRWSTVMDVAVSIALIIATLGLFCLSILITSRRTKEIGIRKALGATSLDILLSLLKDYFRVVFLAFAIGAPLAYLALQQWLQRFAYQAEFGLYIFVASALLITTLTAAAVSIQAVRAAFANPVESIRLE